MFSWRFHLLVSVAALLGGILQSCVGEEIAGEGIHDVEDNDLVLSMLKIVDTKFETLSTRIGGLESVIQTLIQSSFRESRIQTRILRDIGSVVHGTQKTLNQLDKQQGHLRTAVISMSTSVQDVYEKTTDFIKHFDYDSTGVRAGQRFKSIEGKIDQVTGTLNLRIDDVKMHQKALFDDERKHELSVSANITDSMKVIDEKIESFFEIIGSQDGHSSKHFSDASNKISDLSNKMDVALSAVIGLKNSCRSEMSPKINRKMDKLSRALGNTIEQHCVDHSGYLNKIQHSVEELRTDVQNISTRQLQSHTPEERPHFQKAVEEIRSESLRMESEESSEEDEEETGVITKHDWKFLFDVLANMTIDLAESINYYRHTGRSVEKMLTLSRECSVEQQNLRNSYKQTLLSVSGQLNSTLRKLTSEITDEKANKNSVYGGAHRQSSEISNILSNGTQLIELLGDVAHVTSVTLGSSVSQLSESLGELQNTIRAIPLHIHVAVNETVSHIRNQSDHGQPRTKHKPCPIDDYLGLFTRMLNTTQTDGRRLKSIERSAAWIPYIYHQTQLIEAKLNKSISTSIQTLDTLVETKEQIFSNKEQYQGDEFRSKSTLNEFDLNENSLPLGSHVDGDVPLTGRRESGATTLSGARGPHSIDSDTSSKGNNSVNHPILLKEALDEVYATSLRVRRILPALTKLVAEPEPLYSLTGGTSSNEGRVEVYLNGRWGTICQDNLGHHEASLICRHLGFPGGISAGYGTYGPGDGLFFNTVTSCLVTGTCASANIIEKSANCNHRNDFGVICEHMLRFTHAEDNNLPNAGSLQIHHAGAWTPICGYKWSASEARVACHQLGFTEGWVIDGGYIDPHPDVIWFSDVTCKGDESRLDICDHGGWHGGSCYANKSAAVACQ